MIILNKEPKYQLYIEDITSGKCYISIDLKVYFPTETNYGCKID